MTQSQRTSGPIDPLAPYRDSARIPDHLKEWQLPPGWSWGTEGDYGSGVEAALFDLDRCEPAAVLPAQAG